MLPAVIDFSALTKKEIRDFIADAEKEILAVEQTETPVKHYFSKGLYAREIFIPAGTVIVGEIHRHENLNILSKGEISILSIEGCVRVKAPYIVVSPPGVKRLAYVHEDCVWTSIHATNETDLEKLKEQLTVKSYAELEA
jgi:hypothetical protein